MIEKKNVTKSFLKAFVIVSEVLQIGMKKSDLVFFPFLKVSINVLKEMSLTNKLTIFKVLI